jgi:hypothetical protein
MVRALASTITLFYKMIPYHPPRLSKLRFLRLLVPHLTGIQRGGNFWTVNDAAASCVGNVSIFAPIILRPPYMYYSSNSGLPQPPEPRMQESTSNNSPECALAA